MKKKPKIDWSDPEQVREYQRAWRRAHPDADADYRARTRERRRAKAAAYRLANPEKAKAAVKAAWAKNGDAYRASRRAHQIAHRAEITARERLLRKVRYANDPEKIKNNNRNWRAKHPRQWQDILNAEGHKRRARLRDAAVGDTKAIARFCRLVYSSARVRCYWCNKLIPKGKRQRHVDHIVPLAKGGAHAVENLCAACATCNVRKHAQSAERFSGQHLIEFTRPAAMSRSSGGRGTR